MKKRWIVLAAAAVLAVWWLMQAEGPNKTFYSKTVVIDKQRIELPMKVSDFVEKTQADLVVKEGASLKSKEYVVVNAGDFSVGIYNDSKEKKSLLDCQVLGISQSATQVKAGAKPVLFPDGYEIGLQTDKETLILSVDAVGGHIKGDVSITENDTTMIVYVGKRWIDLSSDWTDASENVYYPVRMVLENNVITQIEMIFVDTN